VVWQRTRGFHFDEVNSTMAIQSLVSQKGKYFITFT
jgi:hypothetical protein